MTKAVGTPARITRAVETSRQAAVRGLREATGIDGVEAAGVAVAEFDLIDPDPLDAEIARRVVPIPTE